MSQSIQTGNTAVSGSVTTVGTFTPTKNTVIGATALKAGAGSTTIGTVPAGKIWRVIGWTLASTFAAGAGASSITLNAVGVANLICGNSSNNSVGMSLSYSDAYVLAAGQTAVVTTDANNNAYASIAYIEESA